MIILWRQNMNIEHFSCSTRRNSHAFEKVCFGWCFGVFQMPSVSAMIHDVFNILFNFHLPALCSRHLLSTMTIMQQMNPFCRINNKWIFVVVVDVASSHCFVIDFLLHYLPSTLLLFLYIRFRAVLRFRLISPQFS